MLRTHQENKRGDRECVHDLKLLGASRADSVGLSTVRDMTPSKRAKKKFSHLWWTLSIIIVLCLTCALAGVGVYTYYHRAHLVYPEPWTVDALAADGTPDGRIMPLTLGLPVDSSTREALTADMESLVSAPEMGDAYACVSEIATDATAVAGETEATAYTVWSHNADTAVRPASATKLLTAAAALLQLGEDHTVTTQVIAGDTPGEYVLVGGGDVWLTDEKIEELAAQAQQTIETQGLVPISVIRVDTSLWSEETFDTTWDDADIDAGFIAPMEPLMLYGARIGATTGDVPRSRHPARDVAEAFAQAIAEQSGSAVPVVPDALYSTATEHSGVPLAEVSSAPLLERLRETMLDSDNVMAEAIGREIAADLGKTGIDQVIARESTVNILHDAGFDTSTIDLVDNSGLSEGNRIAPAFFDALLIDATTNTRMRSLLTVLPVASGEGTLLNRFTASDGTDDGAGWVRAKTGTLTATAALVGVVQSVSGHIFTFAFISHGDDVIASRVILDRMATRLREV